MSSGPAFSTVCLTKQLSYIVPASGTIILTHTDKKKALTHSGTYTALLSAPSRAFGWRKSLSLNANSTCHTTYAAVCWDGGKIDCPDCSVYNITVPLYATSQDCCCSAMWDIGKEKNGLKSGFFIISNYPSTRSYRKIVPLINLWKGSCSHSLCCRGWGDNSSSPQKPNCWEKSALSQLPFNTIQNKISYHDLSLPIIRWRPCFHLLFPFFSRYSFCSLLLHTGTESATPVLSNSALNCLFLSSN